MAACRYSVMVCEQTSIQNILGLLTASEQALKLYPFTECGIALSLRLLLFGLKDHSLPITSAIIILRPAW